jgi:hypothetical protein
MPPPPRRSDPQIPKVERKGHLRWVPIALMRTSPEAQRAYYESHAREYADNFDLEGLGYPVLNYRDGVWWIIDGQHRIMALRLIGWDDQQIECECFDGLTEREEAELFLKRNKRRAVSPFDTFKVAVTAQREAESDILRIVRAQGLKVSEDQEDGSIAAVVTLKRIYLQYGAAVLARTLRIARDAYSKDHEAMRGNLLMGLGLVCGRYDGKLDEAAAVVRLAKVTGGPLGLMGKARIAKHNTGAPMAKCVAAAIVETINSGAAVKDRLDDYWKGEG